jgi:hypothetical protein
MTRMSPYTHGLIGGLLMVSFHFLFVCFAASRITMHECGVFAWRLERGIAEVGRR